MPLSGGTPDDQEKEAGTDMIIGIIGGLIGFFVGFLLAFFWISSLRRKDRKNWNKERQDYRQRLKLAQERIDQARKENQQVLDQYAELIRTGNSPVQQDTTKPQQSTRNTQQGSTSPTKKRGDVQRSFVSVQSLKLRFQYSIPQNMQLEPGMGYLRNSQNELIPDLTVNTGMNTPRGYAMEGLFYLYNVEYGGRSYEFSQIISGKMGEKYVHIQSVLAPARVAPLAQSGLYSLVSKGTLLVTDLSM